MQKFSLALFLIFINVLGCGGGGSSSAPENAPDQAAIALAKLQDQMDEFLITDSYYLGKKLQNPLKKVNGVDYKYLAMKIQFNSNGTFIFDFYAHNDVIGFKNYEHTRYTGTYTMHNPDVNLLKLQMSADSPCEANKVKYFGMDGSNNKLSIEAYSSPGLIMSFEETDDYKDHIGKDGCLVPPQLANFPA